MEDKIFEGLQEYPSLDEELDSQEFNELYNSLENAFLSNSDIETLKNSERWF